MNVAAKIEQEIRDLFEFHSAEIQAETDALIDAAGQAVHVPAVLRQGLADLLNDAEAEFASLLAPPPQPPPAPAPSLESGQPADPTDAPAAAGSPAQSAGAADSAAPADLPLSTPAYPVPGTASVPLGSLIDYPGSPHGLL